MTRPVLRTERLELVPLSEAHTEFLVGLDADPEVLRHLFGRALSREEVVGTWLPRRTRPEADARGLGYWVGSTHDGGPQGWWSLALDEVDAGAAELGYRLQRAAWGRGLATEGVHALLEHAFTTVGLEHVWAETMAVNAGSRRVLEKVGMAHVGTDVRTWEDPLPGWEQGEATYRLAREDWLSGPLSGRRGRPT